MSFASKIPWERTHGNGQTPVGFGVGGFGRCANSSHIWIPKVRENHDVAAPRGHGLYDTGCQISGSNRMSAAKVDISSSVSCFWALISIKDSIQDFCAGEMPALLYCVGDRFRL